MKIDNIETGTTIVSAMPASAFNGCSSLVDLDLEQLRVGTVIESAMPASASNGCSSLVDLDLEQLEGEIG